MKPAESSMIFKIDTNNTVNLGMIQNYWIACGSLKTTGCQRNQPKIAALMILWLYLKCWQSCDPSAEFLSEKQD